MISLYEQFVVKFWLFFSVISLSTLILCFWIDGFWTFVKGDLGDVIAFIVILAFVSEIFIRVGRMHF
jgi:hypothetical protein